MPHETPFRAMINAPENLPIYMLFVSMQSHSSKWATVYLETKNLLPWPIDKVKINHSPPRYILRTKDKKRITLEKKYIPWMFQ